MSTKVIDLVQFVLDEEGFSSKPYKDTLGVITFGHGLTNITKEESRLIVDGRLKTINNRLYDTYTWYRNLDYPRQVVICSMVYQLGFAGFSRFKKMIKALSNEDYKEAARQGLDSKWARQTPERAKRQMAILDSPEEL
jgi:lysozyme